MPSGPAGGTRIASLQAQVWPEFMHHDAVFGRLFDRLIAEYAEFQFYAWDDEREEVVGGGNAVPAAWDGDIPKPPRRRCRRRRRSQVRKDAAHAERALCGTDLDRAGCRGQGLSRRMIERMSGSDRSNHELDTLIAPVRPN